MAFFGNFNQNVSNLLLGVVANSTADPRTHAHGACGMLLAAASARTQTITEEFINVPGLGQVEIETINTNNRGFNRVGI